jgi:hypothetical protein
MKRYRIETKGHGEQWAYYATVDEQDLPDALASLANDYRLDDRIGRIEVRVSVEVGR